MAAASDFTKLEVLAHSSVSLMKGSETVSGYIGNLTGLAAKPLAPEPLSDRRQPISHPRHNSQNEYFLILR